MQPEIQVPNHLNQCSFFPQSDFTKIKFYIWVLSFLATQVHTCVHANMQTGMQVHAWFPRG